MAIPRDRLGAPNNFFPGIHWNWQSNILADISFFRGSKLGSHVKILQRFSGKQHESNGRSPSHIPGS